MEFIDFNIHVNGSGVEVRTLCPQCSPTRKKSKELCLAVNTIKKTWFCHHCGWAGGLDGNTKKPIPYQKKQTLPDNVIQWFEKRGIPQELLEQERIGFKNGWIQFPYFKNSVCVNIKHRTHDKKFRQEKGGEKVLYRFDRAMQSTKDVITVTEGEIDALSVVLAGYEGVSIPDGAPSANSKHFGTKFDFLNSTEKLFSKFKKIIIACDNDAPGERAKQELARRLGVERCFSVDYPPGCKDLNEVLVKSGKDAVAYVIDKARPFPIQGIIHPMDLSDELGMAYDLGQQRGANTGWKSMEPYFSVKEGELTIVTGIPGHGKSSWVDCLMLNLINNYQWKFGVFSPENQPVTRHMQTLAEKWWGKSFHGYNFRMSKEEAVETCDLLQDYIKFILPKDEPMNLDNILKYAKILCMQYGINALIIDPFNEVEHDYGRLTETQYISKFLGKLRMFARANSLHIFLIAHPHKMPKESNGSYKHPTLYDVAGGAHFNNKADNGISVFRNKKTQENQGYTDVYILKIRFREVGQIGQVSYKWHPSGRYEEIDEYKYNPEYFMQLNGL